MQLAPGVVIAGKYRLERPLARGGMGSLWEAQHAQLRVPLAIKFMEPTYAASPVGRTRFEREAMAAAQLRHPNVVHVQDYGVEGDHPYIVMELLIGEDLSKRLKRLRRLPIPALAPILTQTTKALRRAHEGGFIHRDLKPSNIFLARGDEEGEEIVKILDFGIAKQLMPALGTDDATKTGEIIGSPSYMSPEQIRGARDIDGRADVWSLGVILFRCLTGKLPFDGDTTPDIIANILTSDLPAATSFVPDLPPGVDAFFQRALARDREQRFQNVRELADAFASVTRMPMGSMAVIDYVPPAPQDPGSSSLYALPGGPAATPLPTPRSSGAPAYPQAHAQVGQAAYPPAELTSGPGVGSGRVLMTPDGTLDPIDPRWRDARTAPADPAQAPTSGGTLTVSPSITGSDVARPPARRPVGLWIIGAGTLVGIAIGLALVVGGRRDETKASEAPPQAMSVAPGTPAPEAPTALPSPALSAAALPTAAAASSPSAAPTTTAKTSTKPRAGSPRPPSTGAGTKRKDWGI
jgi:serine/threonine-protein kinase